MTADTGESPEAAATAAGDDVQFGAVLGASASLVAALRKVATAILALLQAEARVLRASIAWVFVAAVALVAFAVSLWACAVALVGWGLTVATHSPAIALGVLVAMHVVLLAATWAWIMRAMRRASFPAARAELQALGRELRRDVARFQNAKAAPAEPPGPERTP